MNQLELRALKGLELREPDKTAMPNSIGTLVGIPANFNKLSREMSEKGIKFRERIMPGAFTRSLSETDDLHDVRAFVGHDRTRVLARRSAGTLEIQQGSTGLEVRMHLIDTTDGVDTYKNVKAGNLDAMSFGFKPKNTRVLKENGMLVRELLDVDLGEVSIVSWGAYEDTVIAARDLEGAMQELEASQRLPVSMLRNRLNRYRLTAG